MKELIVHAARADQVCLFVCLYCLFLCLFADCPRGKGRSGENNYKTSNLPQNEIFNWHSLTIDSLIGAGNYRATRAAQTMKITRLDNYIMYVNMIPSNSNFYLRVYQYYETSAELKVKFKLGLRGF